MRCSGRRASCFSGVRIRLGTILGRFSIIYFRGLGLRIRVRVWVRVRARVRAAWTTEAETNVGRCVAYPNAIILEDTNSPVRRLPKMRGLVSRKNANSDAGGSSML